jgi:Tfp pilus assembly protein PilO
MKKRIKQKPVRPKPKRAKRSFRTVKLYPYLHLSLGAFFTLIFVAGSIFLANQLTDLSRRTELSRSQLMALGDREISLKKLVEDTSLLEPEIAVIEKALPSEEGVVSFVKEFKQIGRSVSVSAFKFETDQPSIDERENAYIDLIIELAGSLENTKIFLNDLIGLPYLIKLKIVDISGSNQEELSTVVKARIFVNNPFFKGTIND